MEKNETLKFYTINEEYIEKFTLDDIYMKDSRTNEFAAKDGRITDTLIIRYVNEDDKKIICKRRKYNERGFETSTEKSVNKIADIKEAEKLLNMMGYIRFLNMIDTNYMYENDEYVAYIQDVKDLGKFLELEVKENKNAEQSIEKLISFVKSLNLNIGTKFGIRKADLLLKKSIL